MDISRAIASMKERPGFSENVGMVLVHQGMVRGRSRQGEEQVAALEVAPDQDLIEEIRENLLTRPGIFDIVVEAKSGRFRPGDDLLFLIVAGDLRENVGPVLAELLERIKVEAMTKHEITA